MKSNAETINANTKSNKYLYLLFMYIIQILICLFPLNFYSTTRTPYENYFICLLIQYRIVLDVLFCWSYYCKFGNCGFIWPNDDLWYSLILYKMFHLSTTPKSSLFSLSLIIRANSSNNDNPNMLESTRTEIERLKYI